jgi:peptidoglycan/LPS O-acetylase OafA/YrhL
MRYVVRTFVGMFLFAFCWVAVGYGINQMLQIGTCASGGPYVSARQCPDGTLAIVGALVLGIIGMFVAAGIYLTRGTPPGADRPPSNGGIVVWFWTGLFWSLAIGCFLGVWGPNADPGPGGELGGLIVGFMGLIMGAGGLLAINVRRKPRTPWIFNPKVAGAATAAARAINVVGEPQVGDSRIEQLDRLRQTGTLTDAEFETLRNKIARED